MLNDMANTNTNNNNDPSIILARAIRESIPSMRPFEWDGISRTILTKNTNDPAFMAKMYKAIVKFGKVSNNALSWRDVFKNAHPVMIEAWASSLPSSSVPLLDERQVFYFLHDTRNTISPQKALAIENILRRTLPRDWVQRYEHVVEMFKNINYNKPCIGIRMIIVDSTARTNRRFTHLINGKQTPVQIMRVDILPAAILQQLRTGLISRCTYVESMTLNPSMFIYVFAVDADGTLVGAAECTEGRKESLHVEYLCSAKKCGGAGTYVMKTVEYYARLLQRKRVKVISASNAQNFYRKMNYNSNSNGAFIKYLPVRKRVKTNPTM